MPQHFGRWQGPTNHYFDNGLVPRGRCRVIGSGVVGWSGPCVVGELMHKGGGGDYGQELVGCLGPTGGQWLGPGVVDGGLVGAYRWCISW